VEAALGGRVPGGRLRGHRPRNTGPSPRRTTRVRHPFALSTTSSRARTSMPSPSKEKADVASLLDASRSSRRITRETDARRCESTPEAVPYQAAIEIRRFARPIITRPRP
jgi:hypothetical protein